ncbi:hypothetical protein SUNI508_13987 [Seiridium unicorne]|uniref:Ankyrin n=1 Tax=Seiridium unicorne TaxID=138068 RepID=A0ABR2VAH5_9PEZI
MTTTLVDSPLELFRTIIETTIQLAGLRDSVKLRQVNRLFNEEVLLAYETVLIFHDTLRYKCDNFKARQNHEYGALMIPFMAQFLSRRPDTKQAEFWNIFSARYTRGCDPAKVSDLWRLNISTFLHHLLDTLKVPAANRYEPLLRLCSQIDDCQAFESDQVGANSSVPGIVIKVFKGFNPIYFEQFERHVVPAAIILHLHNVYEPLLLSSVAKVRPERWGRKKEEPRFKPLVAAVKSGDQIMVDIALGDDSFDTTDVSKAKDPIGKDHGKNHESIPDAEIGFQLPCKEELQLAVTKSARLGHTAIGKQLIQYIKREHVDLEDKCLTEAMYYASLYGYIDFMQLLIDNGVDLNKQRDYEPGSPQPIDLACWTGNVDAVKLILTKEKGPFGVPTVVAAIFGNKPAVLELVVEAEGPSMSKEEWLTPTAYGTLLEVSASEGHPEALKILLRVGMPANEKLCQGNNGINESCTLMLFAHASLNPRCREVEQILESLRVKRVDMLQAPGKDLFESAYYPSRSTPI